MDRVVASVDGTAITLSDAIRAYRFELWLEGKPSEFAPDASALTLARDRLIDQMLLLGEADAENILAAESSEAAAEALEQVRKKFAGDEAYQTALRSIGINEQQVLEQLRVRDRILRLVDRRLRPSAQVEQADIESYYRKTFLPEFARREQGTAPPLGEVESQIRRSWFKNESTICWRRGWAT